MVEGVLEVLVLRLENNRASEALASFGGCLGGLVSTTKKCREVNTLGCRVINERQEMTRSLKTNYMPFPV